jgi:FlaG/FlaF family flagellin (archaellin)
MKVGMKRPSPAIVISVIAIIVTLTGTAYAALAPHSVSSRQLKPRAVTNSKIADSAVTGQQVAKTTLDGKDFNISTFETVPAATSAGSAANSSLVTGHAAACPAGTILIRGSCYDGAPLGPVLGVKAAAEACAARGGFLPSPAETLSLRGAISLGDGNGTNSVFTDSINANTQGVEYVTTVVNDTGAKYVRLENDQKEVTAEFHYVCAYRLVH